MCNVVQYCSLGCQLKHWALKHKYNCLMYSLSQFLQFTNVCNKHLNDNVVAVIYKFLTGFETNFDLSGAHSDNSCKIQFHYAQIDDDIRSSIDVLRKISTCTYIVSVNEEYLLNDKQSQVIWNFRLSCRDYHLHNTLSLGFVWQKEAHIKLQNAAMYVALLKKVLNYHDLPYTFQDTRTPALVGFRGIVHVCTCLFCVFKFQLQIN